MRCCRPRLHIYSIDCIDSHSLATYTACKNDHSFLPFLLLDRDRNRNRDRDREPWVTFSPKEKKKNPLPPFTFLGSTRTPCIQRKRACARHNPQSLSRSLPMRDFPSLFFFSKVCFFSKPLWSSCLVLCGYFFFFFSLLLLLSVWCGWAVLC